MNFEYQPESLTRILEAAGFDALSYDYIEAVKEEGKINHQIYVNPEGALRYQFSKPVSQENFTKAINSQEFQVEKEFREITNVRGQLKETGDLEQILKLLPNLIRKDAAE